METMRRVIPPLPELGQEDTYYGKIAHKAEKSGDLLTRSAFKVAQYLTLAKSPPLTWPERLKYFRRALEKHAHPKPPIDDEVIAFYQQLQDWVRIECGIEALRAAAEEDAALAERTAKKEVRFKIVSDAAQFFRQFAPAGDKPDWFNDEDFQRLQLIQRKWA